MAYIPPPPAPAPAPTPAGAWYDTSTSVQFTSLGEDVEHSGSTDGHVATTMAKDVDAVRIEYSASQSSYLVSLPATAQARLADSSLIDSAGNVVGTLTLEPQSDGFTYANIGSWVVVKTPLDIRMGDFAFGTPTESGNVPVTGTSSYSGIVKGQTNEAYVQSDGTLNPSIIAGTVSMSFDFGAGTFSGHIRPSLSCWACIWEDALTPLQFAQTVYSSGSTRYSGKFDTALPGANSFEGLFAGPNAVETMATFQAPYAEPYSGKTYEMTGVWVARQTP